MITKSHLVRQALPAVAALTLAGLAATAHAQRGPGGGGGGGRGMPPAFRDHIHALFDAHESIERQVEKTEDGYRSTTTSSDPVVAGILRQHVAEMKQRLDGGRPVRRWDPAFDEFFAHYDDMEVAIEEIEGGLRVTVKGRTPEAVAVARNHAGIVSRFVAHGWDEAHASHAKALGQDGEVAAAKPSATDDRAGAPSDGKGAKCSEPCQHCRKDAGGGDAEEGAKAGCCGRCGQSADGAKAGGKSGACCRRPASGTESGTKDADPGS